MDDIAVVIPTYRARTTILPILDQIGPEVKQVYLVDDCCPDKTGAFVESTCADPRVRVIRCMENLGVGGATMKGYRAAIAGGARVIVKINSMDR